jgi:beta-galactosidase
LVNILGQFPVKREFCGRRDTAETVLSDSKRMLGKEKHLRAEPHKNALNADGLDAAVVDIRLVDENGTLWQDDSSLLSFAVENGMILGVGNGDPNCHEADIADLRTRE